MLNRVIRLFEVNIETGQWILCNKFHVSKVVETYLHPFVLSLYLHVVVKIRSNLELVECMGHLYAVIPAIKLGEYFDHPSGYDVYIGGSKYLPLQFHIIHLEGDVGVHGSFASTLSIGSGLEIT